MVPKRRLAAIVVADVVGYSAMMEKDESDTLSRLFALRTQLIEPAISSRSGRIVKTTGDGWLAEFSSVVNGVDAAVAIQEGLGEWPDIGEPLRLRIGVHLGDVAVEDGDLYGDGVNIAARLEQAADAGGILLSGAAHEQLAGHHQGRFVDAGTLDLKNIARPIRAWKWSPAGQPERMPAVRRGVKPSIAVLPFDNLSGDPDQDHFADGMVEDLITMLSRFHWFRVIARNSSFAFRGRLVDMTEVSTALGARYLLEGSVRRASNRIRVSVQLVDATTSTHVWAERFDRELEDIFDLQDEIVASIVGTVVPQFVSSFQPSRDREQRTTVSSWELAMRGWNLAWRLDATDEGIIRARRLFEDALAEDPENVLALSGIAFTYANPFYQAHLDRDVDRALAAARRAVEIDGGDAFAWCLLGAAEMYGSDFVDAERHLKRAISINPSLALAHGFMALISMWRADSAATDRWMARCRELSPADPLLPFFSVAPSMARFGEGDYSGALEKIDEVLAEVPELPSAWRLRAASLEMLGHHEAAAVAVAEVQALGSIDMDWIRENLTPFVDPEPWANYLDALHRAGVPDIG